MKDWDHFHDLGTGDRHGGQARGTGTGDRHGGQARGTGTGDRHGGQARGTGNWFLAIGCFQMRVLKHSGKLFRIHAPFDVAV